ncbi:MAG: T9SS type A sorting domain-containing protein [Bacteroidales bacterium]|jgi:hypothetical protein|nr:T9SS type A sorting domain-containing protein [Bacteroidales bacterium]
MKHFFTLFIIISISFLNIQHLLAQDDGTWEYVAAETFNGGDGNPGDPYQINSAEQLALFAKYLNEGSTYTDFYSKNYVLTNDIDLSGREWIPIANYDQRAFFGIFDGNKKTIRGMTIEDYNYQNGSEIYIGLFGCISGGAKIYDLILSEGSIKVLNLSLLSYTGGVVGYSLGSTPTEITNCRSSVDIVNNNARTFTGGIIGRSNSGIMISDCSNSGTITGNASSNSSNTGGIIGHCEQIGATIQNCINYGDVMSISAGGDGGITAGGIVGNIKGGYNNITIEKCINHGKISGSGEYNHSGGILGYLFSEGTPTLFDMIECTNNGTVTGTGNKSYIGGLIGFAQNFNSGTGTINIVQSMNNGAVSMENTANVDSQVGGIIGHASSLVSGSAINLNYCTNLGNVNGDIIYAGGLIGAAGYSSSSGDITVNDCYSHSLIKTANTTNAGGIIGYIEDGNISISKCYASGSITANNTYVTGGLLGKMNAGNVSIEYSIAAQFILTGKENSVNRIMGEYSASTLLNQNFAYDGMLLNGALISSAGSASGENGASKTIEDLHNINTYQTDLGWDISEINSPSSSEWLIWDYTSYPYFSFQSTPVSISTLNPLELSLSALRSSDSLQIRNSKNQRIAVLPALSDGQNTFDLTLTDMQFAVGDTVYFVNYESEKSGSYPVFAQCGDLPEGRIIVFVDIPVNNALVAIYRIEPEEKEIVPVDTARYDGGMYYSDNLSLGEYLVSVENVSGYLPTYHTNALIWNQADTVRLKSGGAMTEVNVKLNKIPEIESGDITIEGNVYDASSIKARVALNSTVGIYRSTKSAQKSEDWELVRKVRPDANGYYRFDNLPADVYKVVIDLPGYTLQGNGIEIDAKAGNIYTANDFMVDDVHKTINDVTTSAPVYESAQLNIYPNPFDGEIRISGLEGSYVIRIYDLLGRVVIHKKGSAGEEVLDLGRLPSGIYIIFLEAGGTTVSRKIIKVNE